MLVAMKRAPNRTASAALVSRSIGQVEIEPDQQCGGRPWVFGQLDGSVGQGRVDPLGSEHHHRPGVVPQQMNRCLGRGHNRFRLEPNAGDPGQSLADRERRFGAVVGGEMNRHSGIPEPSQSLVRSGEKPIPAIDHPVDVTDDVHDSAKNRSSTRSYSAVVRCTDSTETRSS